MPGYEFDDHPLAGDSGHIPLMPEDELQDLAENIATHGLNKPIVLFQGKILNGRCRYRAAKVAGYEFTDEDFVEFAERCGDQGCRRRCAWV